MRGYYIDLGTTEVIYLPEAELCELVEPTAASFLAAATATSAQDKNASCFQVVPYNTGLAFFTPGQLSTLHACMITPRTRDLTRT